MEGHHLPRHTTSQGITIARQIHRPDDERPFRINNATYGFALPFSKSRGKEAESPFGEKEEADGEEKAGETTTKKVCFEADTVFNEPRIPHTLSPPHTSPGNRTHTYAVNALEVHDFLTEYWNSQDECFKDDDPYASGDDRTNNEDTCDNYPPTCDGDQCLDYWLCDNSEPDFCYGD